MTGYTIPSEAVHGPLAGRPMLRWREDIRGAREDMARGIALGKGAMPSFMQDLDRDKLAAVIAHIRTLK